MPDDASSMRPESAAGVNVAELGQGHVNSGSKGRKSSTKSKNGCDECRKRRVKCDESKDQCNACAKKGAVCVYPQNRKPVPDMVNVICPKPLGPVAKTSTPKTLVTGDWPLPSRRGSKAQKRRPMPAPQPAPSQVATRDRSPVLLPNPVSLLSLSGDEFRYFQLFQDQINGEISGYYDSVFWSRTVLQECGATETIRHAVIALGALYKTLEKNSESPPSSPSSTSTSSDSAKPHWKAALESYDKAIQAHQMIVGPDTDAAANRTRLMAIILLACFDSFVGDHTRALAHIQNGLCYLESLRQTELVEDELVQMFTRLAIQAKSYDMAFHFPDPIRLNPMSRRSSTPTDIEYIDLGYNVTFPREFSTVKEARIAWDRLCEKMMQCTERLFDLQTFAGPMGVLPGPLIQCVVGYQTQIERWSEAFLPIYDSRQQRAGQEKAAIAVLKMTQIMAEILLRSTFHASEGYFDKFNDEFSCIVNLATEVVNDEEKRARKGRCLGDHACKHQLQYQLEAHPVFTPHIKPSFSANLGIVPPLFVVATKCRNWHTRNQAIALLKSSPRREGMWDSRMLAQLAKRVVDIETCITQEYSLPPTPTDSPESCDSNLSLDMSEMTFAEFDTIMQEDVLFGDSPSIAVGGRQNWGGHDHQWNTETVPDSRRVMIRSAEFDLRTCTATFVCGSRNLQAGSKEDLKQQKIDLAW